MVAGRVKTKVERGTGMPTRSRLQLRGGKWSVSLVSELFMNSQQRWGLIDLPAKVVKSLLLRPGKVCTAEMPQGPEQQLSQMDKVEMQTTQTLGRLLQGSGATLTKMTKLGRSLLVRREIFIEHPKSMAQLLPRNPQRPCLAKWNSLVPNERRYLEPHRAQITQKNKSRRCMEQGHKKQEAQGGQANLARRCKDASQRQICMENTTSELERWTLASMMKCSET